MNAEQDTAAVEAEETEHDGASRAGLFDCGGGIYLELAAQISTGQAAKILGVTVKTLRVWVKGGRVPACRTGRNYRFELSEIMKLRTSGVPDRAPGAQPEDNADELSASDAADALLKESKP